MPADERRKWITGVLVSVIVAIASLSFGGAQWLGNRTHDVLIAKDAELERRLEKVEEAVGKIPDMSAKISAIKGYLEGKFGK